MPVMTDRTEAHLDEFQEQLPPLPAAVFGLQRAVTKRMCTLVSNAVSTIADSSSAVSRTTSRAFNTVSGTARWATGRTIDTATTAAKTVAGQAEAQARLAGDEVKEQAEELGESARRVAEEARSRAVDLVEAFEQTVDGDTTPTGEAYEELTKAELYRRAKAADIDGRSTMTKDELIEALTAA